MTPTAYPSRTPGRRGAGPVRLRKVYEDEEVEVYRAPTEDELADLVVEAIRERGRPVTLGELRELFSGIAGEDRLRRVLVRMLASEELVELPDGTIALPGMERHYVPRRDVARVRPLAPTRFWRRWGRLAPRLRRSGRPLGEEVGSRSVLAEALELLAERGEGTYSRRELVEAIGRRTGGASPDAVLHQLVRLGCLKRVRRGVYTVDAEALRRIRELLGGER